MAKNELKKNTKLNSRYGICESLGQGGFGITYLARDENLGQNVVIKEYFPIALVSRDEEGVLLVSQEQEDRRRFEEGMKRFLKEARVLASLFEIPGVVKVLDYFQEHGTAYLVMEYVQGISLRSYLERTGEEIPFARACEMLSPVMLALERIHKKGLLHRDISPDNLIMEENGTMKLLDFGSAREYFLEQDREKTMTILVKNGYAPPEQYEERGHQGPWTDIYALCATMYEMMTGCVPPGARERLVCDELYAPSSYNVEITPEQESAFLKKGMALAYSERYQSVAELRAGFFPRVREENKKRSVRRGLLAGSFAACAVALAAAAYFHTQQKTESNEAALAGNYDRGSGEYMEYIDFVKKNAVEIRHVKAGEEPDDPDEKVLEPDGVREMTVYTLDEQAVRERGVPANGYYEMEYQQKEVLDILEEAGYSLIRKNSVQQFTVTEESYGVLKSCFMVKDTYETTDGNILVLCYDLISEKLNELSVYAENGKNGAYIPLAADLMDRLLKAGGASGAPDEEELRAGLATYQEQLKSGDIVYFGYEFQDLNVRFYEVSEGQGNVGLCICRNTENAPPYNW